MSKPMTKMRVSVDGCDDSTMFVMEMTDEEIVFLDRVAELSVQHSSYGCQPIIQVGEKKGKKGSD